MYRGSRKHVLDWTARESFLAELERLLAPIPIRTSADTVFMPRGYEAPTEARLEIFGPSWMPDSEAWPILKSWWLKHPAGANTPNWDIAIGCKIEDRPGLVLVEAKANWPELNTAGKGLHPKASSNSRDNHKRIREAIREACKGWRSLDARVFITRDSHYQLANRLAFTWKLAMLGFPVVLMYLGFIGDKGIRDAGAPFSNDDDWQRAFRQYTEATVPLDLFDRRFTLGGALVWLVSRSRPIIEVSSVAAS